MSLRQVAEPRRETEPWIWLDKISKIE
jgi:hypothetical protein